MLGNRPALALFAVTILVSAGRQMSWIFGGLNVDCLGGGLGLIGLLSRLSALSEIRPLAASGLMMRRFDALPALLLSCRNTICTSVLLVRNNAAVCTAGPEP